MGHQKLSSEWISRSVDFRDTIHCARHWNDLVWEDRPEEAQKHQIHMQVDVSSLMRECTVMGCLGVSLSLTETLQACSVCFDKSDAALAQGLNLGILS